MRTQNLRLASLGQPLKLKLHRATGETDLKDISLSQVLVEPLVMIQTLEEYLWPKVNAPERASDAGPSAREVNNKDYLPGDCIVYPVQQSSDCFWS